MPIDGPTEEQVREWLQLSEEATPGPWLKDETSECTPVVYRERPDLGDGACEVIAEADWGTHNDFIFIAAARTATPDLCRALLKAWDENFATLARERLREIDDWRRKANEAHDRANAAERRADEGRGLLERAALFIEQQCTDGPICGAAESTGEDIVAQALAHLAAHPTPRRPHGGQTTT